MSVNKTKLSGLFKKPIPEKAFDGRFEGMLEQSGDKEFFRSCFEKSDGGYRVKSGLDAMKTKRLNKLGKAIKGNRGLFKAGPIIALALVGGALVVFSLFFMNPVLENAAESALEAAFGAKAEVSGIRFSPARMSVSIARIAVADRDSPMTNLFETGRLELRINPAALLRGRLYIEEASAAALAVGTARAESGALPGQEEPPVKAKKAVTPAPPLVDFQNFDAQALLEREKSKLKAPAAFDEAGTAYRDSLARWKGRWAASNAAVAKASASAKAVLKIKAAALSRPDEIAKAIADVKTAADAAKTAAAEAQAISAGIKTDSESLKRLENTARSAVNADKAYLKSLIDPSSGAALSALEPSVRQVLSDKAERYLYYAGAALAITDKLRRAYAGEAKPKKEKALAYRGRDMRYPALAYPRFRLALLSSSFAADGRTWAVELREISSEPALVAEPTAMLLSVTDGRSTVRVDARLDLRRGDAAEYELALDAAGVSLDLRDALAGAGLSGVKSTLAGTGTARGVSGGSMEATLDLELTQTSIAGQSGTFATAFAEAITEAESIRARIRYAMIPGAKDSFAISTNLDAIVQAAVGEIAGAYAKKAMAEIEKALGSWVAADLEGKLDSGAELDSLLAAAKGDDAALAKLKGQTEQKTGELEARARAVGAGVLQGVTIPQLPGLKKP